MISKLHYIIPDSKEVHHADWYKKVCGAGIDWIQLRWKTISDDEFVSRVEDVKQWTDQFEVKLIVNDRIHLIDQFEVDGFHLGKKDMELSEARKMPSFADSFAEATESKRASAGETRKILGGTTNKIEDIIKAKEAGVDYVGLGPYKFTRTKENLDPVLGYLGYLNIMRSLGDDAPPVIAIGNIKTKDVLPLVEVGVHGVAVSSYFNENTENRIKEMLKKLEGNYAFG